MSEAFRINARVTLTKLLPRLRQTLPLPIPAKEVYNAAFPESRLCGWLYDPLPTDMSKRPLPYRNLSACLPKGMVVQFSLLSQAEHDYDTYTAKSFWIKFPHPVTGPPLNESFLLAEGMRTNPDLLRWYSSTLVMETQFDIYIRKIYTILANIANPSELALAWPEVAHAVPGIVPPNAKLRAAARSPRISRIRELVTEQFPPGLMQEFSDAMAMAIMLPDAPLPNAWAGFYNDLAPSNEYR